MSSWNWDEWSWLVYWMHLRIYRIDTQNIGKVYSRYYTSTTDVGASQSFCSER